MSLEACYTFKFAEGDANRETEYLSSVQHLGATPGSIIIYFEAVCRVSRVNT